VEPEDIPAGPLAVDSDAFSYVHMGKGPALAFRHLIAGRHLALPFPVVGELKVAAIKRHLGDERLASLETAISGCVVIPSDARVVEEWARLRAKLINQLKGEGINDLWIAACCLVHDLPLVTNNLGDFRTIAGVDSRLRLVHPDL
jgi:predicted nucleic acid-binding protein